MPEKDLIATIIELAWADAHLPPNGSPENNELRRKAIRWLLSFGKERQSFNWYCDLTGLDSQAIRDRLVKSLRTGADNGNKRGPFNGESCV